MKGSHPETHSVPGGRGGDPRALLPKPFTKKSVVADERHGSAAANRPPRGLDGQEGLASAGRSLEDHEAVVVEMVNGVELLLRKSPNRVLRCLYRRAAR